MSENLSKLLRDALTVLQCDPSRITDFDHHSTIELSLAGLPSLYICNEDEKTWLWSTLVEFDEALMRRRAGDLLVMLIEPCEGAETGTLQLARGETHLELRMLVARQSLAGPEEFAQALDGFYKKLVTAVEIFNG